MKKIIVFLIFIFLSFLFISSNYAINNNNTSNKINVIALIKGLDGTYYNYLHIAIKNNDEIVCQGMTKQHFGKIDNLEGDIKTDILKIEDNGFMNIQCDKNKLIKNGKLKPKIKIELFSDGFYKIHNTKIILNSINFKIKNNRILIGDFKNLHTNFRIKIDSENGILFNFYNNKYSEIKEKIKKEELKHKKLKSEINNIKKIKFIINDIPKNINIIEYQINNQKYFYKKKKDNYIITSDNIIPLIKIGDQKIKNIKINEKKIEIPFQDNFIHKDVILTFNIKNIPEIQKELTIYIDNKKFNYFDNNKYILNEQQIKNGITIKIGNKKKKIKITKSDTIEINYKDFIKEKIKKENINNNYLAISLPKNILDGLGRLSYMEIGDNGSIKNGIINRKDIFFNNKKNIIIIEKFKSKKDNIPTYIIINNKKYLLKDIAINYSEYIKNKY